MNFVIVILDYCNNEVRVYHFNSRNKPKDPEKWIQGHDKKWKESQCYYMCGNTINIRYMDNSTGECVMEELI